MHDMTWAKSDISDNYLEALFIVIHIHYHQALLDTSLILNSQTSKLVSEEKYFTYNITFKNKK